MTAFKLLAAATVLTSLAASPVLAQDATARADARMTRMQTTDRQASAQQWRGNRPADMRYDRRANDNRGHDNGGFWPGAVAAGIVGGAVATAGAIASAPFDDSYAYDTTYDNSYAYAPAPAYDGTAWDNGWNTAGYNSGYYGQSYAQRNGFVCTPGTYYRNDNGRTQLCQ